MNAEGTVPLWSLPMSDLLIILNTPDYSDLAQIEVLDQVIKTAGELAYSYAQHPTDALNRANEAIDSGYDSMVNAMFWHFIIQYIENLMMEGN